MKKQNVEVGTTYTMTLPHKFGESEVEVVWVGDMNYTTGYGIDDLHRLHGLPNAEKVYLMDENANVAVKGFKVSRSCPEDTITLVNARRLAPVTN